VKGYLFQQLSNGTYFVTWLITGVLFGYCVFASFEYGIVGK